MDLSQRDSVNRVGNSKLLEETLKLNQTANQTTTHLTWGFINAAALIGFVFNLMRSPENQLLSTAQKVMAFFLTLNTIFHFIKFSFNKITMQPVCLSPKQRSLFGFQRNDNLFRPGPDAPVTKVEATPKKEEIFTALHPMNLSNTSCLSPSALSETTSPRVLPFDSQQLLTPPRMVYLRRFSDHTITDELSLSRYLDAVEEHERRAAVTLSVETSPGASGSFWSRTSPRSSPSIDVSPLLRRTSYQMSSTSPVAPIVSPGAHHSDDGGSPVAVSHSEFWRKFKIDSSQLTQWNGNLRMWISLTILQRLVSELDHIDAAFVRCGLSDLHLGSVGLDRLKRTACLPQVAVSIPSLPRLVPFLELSQHQEYLVTRIRELAKGGSMSEFRWNSGGKLHGKPWEEHLPTDSALVMHLITTYLDVQLMAPSQRTDAPSVRPFSSAHVVRSPERPPAHAQGLIIHQPHLNPPHFVLVDGDDTYEIPPGRNNVFYTFLLFLHLLKTRDHGMLGPLNLGRSGVNVLWVVDS